jgi:hypothetical protein
MCRRWFVLCCLLFLSVGVAVAQGPTDSVCQSVKDGTPGLFGLCLAYCEAHDCGEDPVNCVQSNQKILDKYDAKKTDTDLPMPCTATGVDCPCFVASELLLLDTPFVTCETGIVDAVTSVVDPFQGASTGPGFCFYEEPTLGNIQFMALGSEQELACRVLIRDPDVQAGCQ